MFLQNDFAMVYLNNSIISVMYVVQTNSISNQPDPQTHNIIIKIMVMSSAPKHKLS
ncbi:AGAP009697-PA [Anopheles gambiae str. PEST]|uniref:AGAP009697-PA n=1 Tax=Anopheles gambiae TaxID=7165 RepID=A0NFQ8_ANOGA|nr:AGAP009697-PA [Anopheles gambiae str. PEST]